MKVLLAVDGSKHTKKMLAYLTTHDGLLGPSPELIVINVQPAIPARALRAVGREMVESYHHAEAEAVFAPVCKFLDKHGFSYTTAIVVGHVAEEILKHAKKVKADLIVMGSRGHGSLSALLMGSVAQKVVANADRPVMIIH